MNLYKLCRSHDDLLIEYGRLKSNLHYLFTILNKSSWVSIMYLDAVLVYPIFTVIINVQAHTI